MSGTLGTHVQPCYCDSCVVERMTAPAAFALTQAPLPVAPLNKRQFMQQYVLNRCMGHTGGMEGVMVASDAAKAWEVIERECAKEHQ